MSPARFSSRLPRQILRHPNPWVRGSALAATLLVAAVAGMRGCHNSPTARARDGDAASSTAAGYARLPDARLVGHPSDDGDSFRVRQGGREFELRLYFVDAPEKYLSDRYPEQRSRVAEQARDLGLSVQDTVALGRKARTFVQQLLGGQAFTVYTKWERVFDGERFHGFVELPDPERPGKTAYLSEILMRRGLARVHTKGADTPDGRSWRCYREHLLQLQPRARTKP